jgi:pimeloyl-ACP methyl ester carboxylesterase
MDKSQVLAEMQAARDEFDALLGQLSDEQMLDATLEGGRSVKDMLSHIAAWERRCARWLADSLRGEVPERPEPGVTWDQMDDLNERDFLRAQAETLQEAWDDYHRSYLELFDVVNAMPEEDFGEAHRFSWWEGRPISDVIAANSFEHYREHAEQIQEWLKRKQPVTGFVESNGTQLYYEMMDEGHPLVLIHGGYMDRRMWDDQFAVFAQHYRVIRYDVRGFGQTELPPVPYTDREDLYHLLSFLGLEKTYLMGLSLGGEIAIDFTLDYPDMVDALILVGSSISGAPIMDLVTQEQLQQYHKQWAPFEEAQARRDLAGMVEGIMSHPTLVPSASYPSARMRVRENLSEYSFAWVLESHQKQATEPPAWGRLKDIHVPTLLILGGDDDELLHTMADKLEQDIPNVKRVTIPQTHHMPNMEKPDEFNRIVLDFLIH